MSQTYRPGDAVEFHSEWPFETVRGVVLAVGERRRECGTGRETFVRAAWERCSYAPAEIRDCATWNARLRVVRAK